MCRGANHPCMGAAELLSCRNRDTLKRQLLINLRFIRKRASSTEKSWHGVIWSVKCAKLVSSVIDAQWEESCRPRPQDVSQCRKCKIRKIPL